MNKKANYYLDISNDLCPITLVKTKLAIEKMQSGDTLEVRLRGHEPIRNIPLSVQELGHSILYLTPELKSTSGIHKLYIRKN
ncbi:MAG: sulfurtransferase TusA family protein [Rhodospirillaceae bacterium]|jgi:TusA-related sulfurtransferase|nr:sulfurtransferase TusA family protein [Rhodospirillaceae bacterium]